MLFRSNIQSVTTETLHFDNLNLWFKPIDMLKIDVGATYWHGPIPTYWADYMPNMNEIGPWWFAAGASGWFRPEGFGATLTPMNGLDISTVINPGYLKFWIEDGKFRDTYLIVNYNDEDIGSIGFSSVINYGIVADNTYSFAAQAGWLKNFNPFGVAVQGGAYTRSDIGLCTINGGAQFDYNADGLRFNVSVPVTYDHTRNVDGAELKDFTTVVLFASFAYTINNNWTPVVIVREGNVLDASNAALLIAPGIYGNVCENVLFEARVNINITPSTGTSFDVPLIFTFNL